MATTYRFFQAHLLEKRCLLARVAHNGVQHSVLIMIKPLREALLSLSFILHEEEDERTLHVIFHPAMKILHFVAVQVEDHASFYANFHVHCSHGLLE